MGEGLRVPGYKRQTWEYNFKGVGRGTYESIMEIRRALQISQKEIFIMGVEALKKQIQPPEHR